MRFDRILSFGRTGEELLEMFALEPGHLVGLRVLDCPGGPGSLSTVLRAAGAHPSAVDPRYALSPQDLDARTRADISAVASQLPGDSSFRDDFDSVGYVEAKLEAFRQFQLDRRTHTGGYVAAVLHPYVEPRHFREPLRPGHQG